MQDGIIKRNWNLVHLVLILTGVVFILMAIFLNPYLIERFISTDQDLEDATFRKIFVINGIFLCIGLLLLVLARYSKQYSDLKGRILSNILTFLGSLVFTLLLLEIGLKFVNNYIKPFNRQRHAFFRYHELLGWTHQPNKTGSI